MRPIVPTNTLIAIGRTTIGVGIGFANRLVYGET